MSALAHLTDELAALEAKHLRRHPRKLEGPQGAIIEVDGRRALNFCSNNYLGLADHPAVRAAAVAALHSEGVGAGASRLIAGNLRSHRILEQELAAFHDAQAALLFTSGYHANLGVIGALAGPDDTVFSDRLAHASLIDAARLARASVQVYSHCDVDDLSRRLAACRSRRRIIVTESLFSMDGDLAPLVELRALADRHDAILVVDEAHATGVLGPGGQGHCASVGIVPDVRVATLGKALGVAGAYVTGSTELVEYLRNRARTFVFTTALPPCLAAAAAAAVAVCRSPEGDRLRADLLARIAELAAGLTRLGLLGEGVGRSPIFPLLVGDERKALLASDRLLEQGFFLHGIRPPTVPAGTSRLRLTLMAGHEPQQVQALLAAIEGLAADGLVPRLDPRAIEVARSRASRCVDQRPQEPEEEGRATSRTQPAFPSPKPEARGPRPEAQPQLLGDNSPALPASSTSLPLAEKDKRFLWHPFTQMQDWIADDPLVIDRAEGCYLVDIAGKRYLDGVSSLWANVHGHRRPEIDAAIRAQLDRVAHSTLLGLANVPSIELAERLVTLAPAGLSRVFYSDSGSTAVEVALKMALQYWAHRGHPSKRRFVALADAYHGDTIGSVSVGGIDLFHERFRPLLFAAIRAPSPHWYRCPDAPSPVACSQECVAKLERILAAQAGEIAALVIEPLVQGAAGIIVHPPGFLREVAALCRKHEVLLICDEVATGFGRTGTMFACEQEGVAPDFLCLAKGLTGGYLPLAATLTTEEVFSAFLGNYADFKTFFHGHTYTGNPLACAAGLASLDVFAADQVIERLPPKIGLLRELLDEQVSPLAHVGQVRQCGLMVGIELVRDRASKSEYPPAAAIGARACLAARRRGVILRPLGSVVVLMPPLSIAPDELRLLVGAARSGILEATEESAA